MLTCSNSVKSTNQIPSIANLLNKAGVLRSREARTAVVEPHITPALFGFFVRLAQKVRSS